MISILLVSADKDFFSDFARVDKKAEIELNITRSGTAEQALVMVAGHPYTLVVSDEQLPDMTGLSFIEKVIKTNPMVNCAIVSRLPHDDFHEASEGLGVLMQLPPGPDKSHAKELLDKLDSILQLFSKSR